jgi:hypothetical protein
MRQSSQPTDIRFAQILGKIIHAEMAKAAGYIWSCRMRARFKLYRQLEMEDASPKPMESEPKSGQF